MNKKNLYIFDDKAGLGKLATCINSHMLDADLAILSIDDEAFLRLNSLFKRQSGVSIRKLDFIANFNAKAFEIRDEFIKFIADTGSGKNTFGLNLKQYFKYPFRDFSAWWFSLIAEKNTEKTASFHRLVQLLTIKDFCSGAGYKTVFIDLEDKVLTEALKDNAVFLAERLVDLNKYRKPPELRYVFRAIIAAGKYFLIVAGRAILAKLSMPSFSKRKKALGSIPFPIITYFPYLDQKKLEDGIFINKYFEPLETALKNRDPKSFAYLAIFVTKGGFNWRQSINLAKKANLYGTTLILCEEWLSFFDFLILPFLWSYFGLRYFFISKKIRLNFKYPKTGLDIWSIFRGDWNDSFCGYCMLEGILYYRIFNKVNKALKQGAIIPYFAEMHPWEKALNIACQADKGIKTMGIQHTVVPYLLLMYFNDKSELLTRDYSESVPRPDYLACVGEITRKIFIESGWEKEKVFSWGAMRFKQLRYYLEDYLPWERRKAKVVVALSIIKEESKEILRYVYYAFKDALGVSVVIKSHPFMPIEALLDELGGITFEKPVFILSDSPLFALLKDAKVMIVKTSSASLEAVASGCAVVIPQFGNIIDTNPLSKLTGFGRYAENPAQLKDLAMEILQRDTPLFSRQESGDFIRQYFSFFDSSEELLKRLEEFVCRR